METNIQMTRVAHCRHAKEGLDICGMLGICRSSACIQLILPLTQELIFEIQTNAEIQIQ